LSYRALEPEPAEQHANHTAAAQRAATTQAGEAPAAEPAPPARQLAESLPSFTLDGVDGEPHSIASWPGKPLLINFWATWCAPCLREIPMLKQFQGSHEDMQVVGIAVDRDEPVIKFAGEMDFNYPILIGQNDAWEAAAAFGVDFYALPFTVFTAPDGSVLGVHTGELHQEHLDELTSLLADLRDAKIDLTEARARLAGRM
jgi:thiol-disulfide isomerase/thioredoxin